MNKEPFSIIVHNLSLSHSWHRTDMEWKLHSITCFTFAGRKYDAIACWMIIHLQYQKNKKQKNIQNYHRQTLIEFSSSLCTSQEYALGEYDGCITKRCQVVLFQENCIFITNILYTSTKPVSVFQRLLCHQASRILSLKLEYVVYLRI